MSWDFNPFKHIEVVDDNGIRVHCHSCGGTRPRPSEPGLLPHTPIIELFMIACEHVLKSHGRTEADFETWSIY